VQGVVRARLSCVWGEVGEHLRCEPGEGARRSLVGSALRRRPLTDLHRACAPRNRDLRIFSSECGFRFVRRAGVLFARCICDADKARVFQELTRKAPRAVGVACLTTARAKAFSNSISLTKGRHR
jgi:hypothetical protein